MKAEDLVRESGDYECPESKNDESCPRFEVNWDSPLIMETKLDGDVLIMPKEWRDEDDDEDEDEASC